MSFILLTCDEYTGGSGRAHAWLGKNRKEKSVNAKAIILCVLAGTGFIASALGQTPVLTGALGGEGGMPRGKGSPSGPVGGDLFRTPYIRLGSNTAEGLLYEPTHPGAHARIGLVYSHPE